MEPKINWYSWDKNAFRLADMLGRPILLSISAVWCHWCHVMDETTFADEEVARLINSAFVPIRVDTDKRPDINRRYNMGGWPTTAFLNSRGEILTGSTYIPPEPMRNLLRKITQLYRQTGGILSPSIPTLIPRLKVEPAISAGSKLSSAIVGDVLETLEQSFDSVYGGFGEAPKFPTPAALSLVLSQSYLNDNEKLKTLATKTLDEMASGEIFDQEMGGFFRYATARNWANPHYEKMLEDNARLLLAYLEAFQTTGNPRYRGVAEDILTYVGSTLRAGKDGGFYGSQDADEKYYRLGLKEREKRTPPRVDTTIYTDWNALMASGYLKAAAVLEREELKDYALKTLSFLHDHCFQADRGMNHYFAEEKARLPGILADQALTGLALLEAYESTGRQEHIRQAEEVMELTRKNLGDKEGGFFDLPEDPEAQGHLRERDKPILQNSQAAEFLLRLNRLTERKDYLSSAEAALKIFESSHREYGIEAASYARVVDLYLRSPIQIVLVGKKGEQKFEDLHRESLKVYEPQKIIRLIADPSETKELEGFPKVFPQAPAAYVCADQRCSKPASSPRELLQEIAAFKGEG